MNEAVQKDETPSAGLGSQNDASLLEQLATRIEEVKDLVGIDARKHLAVIEGLLQKAQSENAELKTNVVEALSVGTQLREENRALQEELVQLKLLDMVDQTQTLNSIAYEYNEDIINAHRKERDELLAALEDCQQQVRFLEDENMLLRDKVGESEGMNEKRFENEYTISKDSSVIGVEDGEDGDPRHEATSVRSCSTSYPSADNLNNPISIAEALKNEATPDIILAAIGMLQGYVVIQELLEKEKMSRKQLTNEVLELNEIINAKTFKPPSAWAERELKYKQEKRQWEEERKVADAEISTLKKQLEDLRNSSGTSALEHRIEFLESRLLESERNLAIARATIHEMELASRASEGEFSMSGVKPYLGPRGAEGDVSHAVEKLETSFNGTPVRQSPSISSSSNVFSPSNVAVIAEAQNLRRTTDYGRFIGNEKENELSKVRLDQLSGGHDVFRTPETVPEKVRRLERELMQLNADKFQLNQELKGLKASVSTNSRHELGRPDENGVDVSKTEINLSNAIEPCNDSLKLDESQAEILVVQQRIEEIERLLELMNEEERNLYDQLDFLTASQRGSEARERQSQHDIVRVAIDGSPIEEDTKGNLKSEVGAEVDEEILDQAKHDLQQHDVPGLIRAKIELETQYEMVLAHASKIDKKLAKTNREKRGMLMLMHDVLLSQETDLLAKFLVYAAKHEIVFDSNSSLGCTELEDDKMELSRRLEDDLRSLKQKLSSMTIDSEERSKLESTASFASVITNNNKSISHASQAGLPNESDLGISNLSGQDECNLESIDFLKEENRTLMELLVDSKVKLAEVEGDFLESKRALRRARDKQKELMEQVLELQGSKKPVT